VVLDNLLLYLTGGFAAVHTRTNWETNFGGGGNPFISLQEDNWRWGWTAGFGTEYAWSPNWTVKFETLYVETLDKDYSKTYFAFGGNNTVNFTDSNHLWVTRIGLNYRFGGPGVVAKY
jgi:outer membrane immunogenic protein